MMNSRDRDSLDRSIVELRPKKNPVDPFRPYAFLVEPECNARRQIQDVATIFLTNRECPFRCLMCDLWKNTTDDTVPLGAIPSQIRFALDRLPTAQSIKLYNSGNFFDLKAIPRQDYESIATAVAKFQTVIVENHPKLCNDDCLRFRDLLPGELEVAMGLETVHEEVLRRLNKQMTTDDFRRAAEYLVSHGIRVRAFILLRPPYLSESEGLDWAERSLQFAFDCGVECCSVIPTRGGNGIMERLADNGEYSPPTLRSLETVLAKGIEYQRGRVFVDLWDAERFSNCPHCRDSRISRLRAMNLQQIAMPEIHCECRRGIV